MNPNTLRRANTAISVLVTLYSLAFVIAFTIFLVSFFAILNGVGESAEIQAYSTHFLSLFSDVVLADIMLVAGISGFLASRRVSRAPFVRNATIAALVVNVIDVILTCIESQSLLPITTGALNCVFCGALLWSSTRMVKYMEEQREKGVEEAVALGDPSYLGFLRFIEFTYILHVLFVLTGLIFTSRDAIVYTFAELTDMLNVVLDCVALWLIISRYRIARPASMVFALVNIALLLVNRIATGQFNTPVDVTAFLFEALYPIILFLYFTFSKRVQAVCTRDFDASTRSTDHKGADWLRKPLDINRRSWGFYRNLIMYFCVFSLLGHYMEAAFCQLIRLGLVQGDYDPSNTMLWRDWFYPFPMEGAAVVIIGLFLYPLKNWLVEKISNPVLPYVISFVINGLMCGTMEYVCGKFFFNQNLQNWNYSNMPFNIEGQVCLQNVVGFALAASIIAWIVYPMLEYFLSQIPDGIMNFAFVVIVAAYAIPQTLYLIDPPVDVTETEGAAATANATGAYLAQTGGVSSASRMLGL